MAHTYNPSDLEAVVGDQEFRASLGCNGTCLKTIRTPTADQNGKTKTRTREENGKRPKIGTGLCVVLILISNQNKGMLSFVL